MGLLDKAKQAMKGKSSTIEKGIDAAVKAADTRTNGKYRDKLSQGAERAKAKARTMDDERPDDGESPGDDSDRRPPRP